MRDSDDVGTLDDVTLGVTEIDADSASESVVVPSCVPVTDTVGEVDRELD